MSINEGFHRDRVESHYAKLEAENAALRQQLDDKGASNYCANCESLAKQLDAANKELADLLDEQDILQNRACELHEQLDAANAQAAALEKALGYTYFFRQFTEEWHDMSNAAVVEFIELRDAAMKPKAGQPLLDELARLRRGDFTPEEFQNLCHNIPTGCAEEFCDGCEQYHQQLFGGSPITQLKYELAKLREECELYEWFCNRLERRHLTLYRHSDGVWYVEPNGTGTSGKGETMLAAIAAARKTLESTE